MSGLYDSGPAGECRVPVFTAFGEVYATRNAGPHDWRLFKREPKLTYETQHQKGAPGWGNVLIQTEGQVETWYCTRCRVVDERFVPTP